MSSKVLLIDDSEEFRSNLAILLREHGFTCLEASDGIEGLAIAEEKSPDVVVCDLMMPGLNGVEVVERLSVSAPGIGVILITGFASLDTAVQAFRHGAADYILKPLDSRELVQKILRCIEFRQLRRELNVLRKRESGRGEGNEFVGKSSAVVEAHAMIERVAAVDSTVLITGETGTGKGLVARTIHRTGNRRDRAWITLNCASIPRDLFESELFGHTKGAFTGAVKQRPGFFEVADGGTLFLDEIAEIPLELQAKLLRAIEDKEITRVGSTRPIPADARIIAATNRSLETEVKEGRFREDLYFRVCVVEIALPPLRERKEDIPLLVDHLIRRLNARLKRKVLGVDNAGMRVLMSAPWPGNVRELENVLERGILLTDEEHLGVRDLPTEMSGTLHFPKISDDLRVSVRAYELRHIRQVLEFSGGNREEAARRLGINPSTLYRRLKDLQIGLEPIS